ncbi:MULTISPECIES: pyridoxamine 5'-phosphate oxidase family protein [unclassified Brevibacterium]|uniref:pyridoxamine 5'-phosphate oxidase family protein n=1 Tax=unclassified Brevibacterium TaxID=2614124 RepID=UPI001868634D|nr:MULTISPECIES: pyridoxamine 5'-phosphate oxidase family protein [unclassified Brevibacterium]
MNRNTNDESTTESKARDIAQKLDEATEPLGGTSQVESRAKVGYTEEDVESRAQDTATEQGVSLHRNPDGSHTAVDESQSQSGKARHHLDGAAAAGNPDSGKFDETKPEAESATDDLRQADVVKILRGADSVMLATALSDGTILTHPMAPQEITDDADVWFFLDLGGAQTDALKTNPAVNISIAEAGNWLSVAGHIDFVDDRTKIKELWSKSASAWFADSNDPNLGLVKVTTESAQHWGLPGGKLSGLVRIVKAKVSGDRSPGGTATTEL